jgi:cbb3-type cytochrome oxidase subunit 3
MAAQAPSTGAVQEAGKAAVDVGHIFGQGGTDGLILYALILGTFLMFIVALGAVWLAFRSIAAERRTNAEAFAKKDELNNQQTQAFVASADRTAAAISALAVSTATQTSVQAGQTQILARMEGATHRVETLLSRLDA